MAVSEQDLMDMELHKEMTVGLTDIQRVVGGWIYWRATRDKINIDRGTSISVSITGVFVPEPPK